MSYALFVEEVLLAARKHHDCFVESDVLIANAAVAFNVSDVLHRCLLLGNAHLTAATSPAATTVYAEQAAEDRHKSHQEHQHNQH